VELGCHVGEGHCRRVEEEEASKGVFGKFRRRFGSGDMTAEFMMEDGKP
jgi:hypothetical protein